MLVVQKKVSSGRDALDESEIRDDILLWIQDVVFSCFLLVGLNPSFCATFPGCNLPTTW
jgi:hypothetical protein